MNKNKSFTVDRSLCNSKGTQNAPQETESYVIGVDKTRRTERSI